MIKEKIYDYFNNQRLEKEKKEPKETVNFAPSYLNDCRRKIYYKKKNVPQSNPTEDHAYIKFALGDATHEKIQNIINELGLWIEGEDWKEKEWKNLNWIYRFDGLINIEDVKYIIEIKSTYMSGYKAIEQEAKPEHELQLLMYMIFENIENGILLYIGRDNGYMIEYQYKLDYLKNKYRDFMTTKLMQLKELKTKIDDSILPEKDFQIQIKNNKGILSEKFVKDKVNYKSDWQCSYCNWKNLCWEKELKEIKNNLFYINKNFIKGGK